MKTAPPSINLLVALCVLGGIPISAVGPVQAQTGSALSVTAFGARCDGVTDDASALQAAVNKAQATGQTLTFPANATCAVSSNSNGYLGGAGFHAIVAIGSGATSLTIQGNGATILDTITPTAAKPFEGTLMSAGSFALIDIENLNFTSTHTPVPYGTAALGLSNGVGNVIGKLIVSGGIFTNHTNSISFSGTLHSVISHNAFYLTNRDYAILGGEPTQTIRVGANTAAPVYDTEIAFNTYNGCTADANLPASVEHFCGDGLVIGFSHGWKVHDNTIHGFSFEGIFLVTRANLSDGPIPYPTTIYNNHVDATRVPGQRPNSYNIRCDEPGCDIHDNQLIETVQGILVDGIDTGIANLFIPNVFIHDNQLQMAEEVPQDPNGGAGTQYGILTQNAVNPTVARNQVIWMGSHANGNTPVISGITLGAGTVAPTVDSNTVNGGTIATSTTALRAFEFFHTGTATLDSTNRATAAETGLYTTPGANPIILAPFFIFSGNQTNVAPGTNTNLNATTP